ncbi:hypothetical protein Micbo1qcDRAFT_214831 [Microdochium bolleyi]|uniref:Heterokaryon incompatibility domain-containing protein n=1 Tax=Microdochium bolleyi TaxID=196109 RepID=A0A136IT95_9PEZI|nr:hypothetical protein Micbo1qcDRAFT_214831 [Microdochium bolleyi]
MSASPQKEYQYDGHLDEAGEIRLFSASRNGNGAIHCEFIHAQLQYSFAISYTWGSEAKEETDICVRDPSSFFWADAICINQGNHAEKSHQVRQMPRVYEAAEQTFVCLWPAANPDIQLRSLMRSFENFDLDTSGKYWPVDAPEWRVHWFGSLARRTLDFELDAANMRSFMSILSIQEHAARGTTWMRRFPRSTSSTAPWLARGRASVSRLEPGIACLNAVGRSTHGLPYEYFNGQVSIHRLEDVTPLNFCTAWGPQSSRSWLGPATTLQSISIRHRQAACYAEQHLYSLVYCLRGTGNSVDRFPQVKRIACFYERVLRS